MKHTILSIIFLGFIFFYNNALARAFSDEEIFNAVKAEDTSLFLEMMAAGIDVNEKDENGNTPLIIASSHDKVKFAKFIIDMGANVNKKNYRGTAPLHRAASIGSVEIINLLLDNDAFVDMPDLEGITPLMSAVIAGKQSSVEVLINRGANVAFRNMKGKTAIDIAKENRLWNIYSFLTIDRSNDTKQINKPSYSWDY